MKNFKFLFVYLLILFPLTSCGTIKEGFSMQKKDNTDEFLVEKKNPLKLPPNFDELPIPNSSNNLDQKEENNEIKDIISNTENSSKDSNNTSNENISLEKILLDKIKKN